jgi:hypothetical protein
MLSKKTLQHRVLAPARYHSNFSLHGRQPSFPLSVRLLLTAKLASCWRPGRLAFRLAFERPDDFEVVHLNDLAVAESTAYLLQFDSVHGERHMGPAA